MPVTLNKDALDRLAFCFGSNSAQYNAIVAAATKSPLLAEELNTFGLNGWTFQKGSSGSGTFADSSKKVIVFDSSWTDSSDKFVTVVAHELGHALFVRRHGRLSV